MATPGLQNISRRVVGGNVWLSRAGADAQTMLAQLHDHKLEPDVLATEAAVGRAMFAELEAAARSKEGDLVVVLLGGRGAQSLHRLLGELAETAQADQLLRRLHVFTQDALAPMQTASGLSFVRDFERLLGAAFFKKIKSFTSMRTDTDDLEGELAR